MGKDASGSDQEVAPQEENSDRGLMGLFSGTPGWAWLFIFACLAIPVVNRGGAIAAAFGFGGAAGCAQLAKNPEWGPSMRLLVCIGITVVAWALYWVFVIIVLAVRG